MRWGRLALIIVTMELAAVAATAVSVAVNMLSGSTAGWLKAMERHPLRWSIVATVAVAVASLLAWGAQRRYDQGLAELVPAVQRPEPWVVDRPAEVGQIVRALKRKAGGTVGITTAVHGVGGFGKTTVAKMVRADRRVLRRYRGRVHWVTLGRDAGKEALPGLVNGLIAQLDPNRAVTFTDARQAADQLAAILAKGPRRLLILDDVWTGQQLAAFPVAGRCARLVTTRSPSLTAEGTAVPVRVDQMTDTQARALLLNGLPPLPTEVVSGLLAETGRWPLLLRLVNKILIAQARLHNDITVVAEDLMGKLSGGGILQVDQLTGAAGRHLDVGDPDQRSSAVRATIEASTHLLTPNEYARLAELAVFAEDEAIPLPLITALWQAISGIDRMTAGTLLTRLADLSLLTAAPGGAVTMHDVIRDYLREQLGPARLARLHRVLLDGAAAGLPAVPAVAAAHGITTAWWKLPEDSHYLRDHLVEHMLAAGLSGEAEELATDLRWAGARLEQVGPSGPYSDLSLIGTHRTERLRRLIGQAAHLLAPTDPPHSVTDILYSRISHDPDCGRQLRDLSRERKLPALVNKWPLPDLPDPNLRVTLVGHTDYVAAVAFAPDGTWLATGSEDKTVRIWDAATGHQRAVLTGHKGPVREVTIAPDGTWLASGSLDGTVRIWDAATGHQRARLRHISEIRAVAIAPNGTGLAGTDWEGTVRIWDPAKGRRKRVPTDDTTKMAAVPDRAWRHQYSIEIVDTGSKQGTVRILEVTEVRPDSVPEEQDRGIKKVLFAPDGTWLAAGSNDGTVRIWDAATGRQRATFTGHGRGRVVALAIAPDGTWLATGSNADETVRIWDAATGHQRATFTGHTRPVSAVAIAPDGTWLATGSLDKTVRIWDSATGYQRAILTGHEWLVVEAAIAPDGTWLATVGDQDGSVRIWDAATGRQRAILTGHTRQVRAVAVSPDGTWLATAGKDGTARIWDAATSRQRAILTGHTDTVVAAAIAPGGTWLATATLDGVLRIWDPATHKVGAVMRVDDNLDDCKWSPDGQSLVAGGDAGLYLFTFKP